MFGCLFRSGRVENSFEGEEGRGEKKGIEGSVDEVDGSFGAVDME